MYLEAFSVKGNYKNGNRALSKIRLWIEKRSNGHSLVPVHMAVAHHTHIGFRSKQEKTFFYGS